VQVKLFDTFKQNYANIARLAGLLDAWQNISAELYQMPYNLIQDIQTHLARLTCIILLSLIHQSTLGQHPSYIQYTTSNGLASYTVYCALQDDQGYIWFGTDKGVSKFNGYDFENYNYKNGLGDNEIFDIYQDSKKRIWFSGYNGKLSFYSHGKFNNIENNDTLKNIDFKGIGLKFLEDSQGNLYYITNQSLYSSIKSGPINVSSESNLYSYLMLNGENDAYLMSAIKDTFVIANLTQHQAVKYPNFELDIKIMPRINSKPIIINDLLYFNYANNIIEVDLLKNKYAIVHQFENAEQGQCFQKINDVLIWIGTQNGLYIFDTKKKIIVSRYLKNVSVSSINLDNEKNIWVTSLNKGVFQIINKNISFYNSTSGLDFDKCIYLNTIDSNVIVGSQNYRCAFIKDNTIKNIMLPQQQGEGKIESAKKGKDGNILISTGSGFFEINSQLVLKKSYKSSVTDILIGDSITTIAQGYRILRFQNKPYNIEGFLKDGDQFTIPPIKIKAKKIFRTRDSSLYVIGNFGALKISGNDLTEIHPHPALKTNIVDFAETKDGIQWFASSLDGLLAIYNHTAYHFTHQEGLPSDFVSSITIDDHENVWVGTQNGLCKISYQLGNKKTQIRYYNKTAGLASNAINDIIFFNGKIWAATDFGLCSFTEADLAVNRWQPQMIIESVRCGDEIISPINNKYIITNKKNSLKIKFIGISMSSLSNMKYLYRLDGPEKKWTETKNTELEYPSLPPGIHTLEIKTLNSQNKPSDIKTIVIEVIPSFYQTIWFYLIIALGLIIIAVIIIRLRIRSINQKHQAKQYLLRLENEKLENEKKEVEFNKNLSELKQKALMLHMNPHFIFNSINAINGFYAMGDIDNAKTYVSMFSKLLRTILDFSQKKFITIKQEVDLLEQYLKLNQIRFNDRFTYSITVSPYISQSTTQIPPMIIQPFVENSIIHGITPMDKKGHVSIQIYADEVFLHCMIEDNGIGIEKSEQIHQNRVHHSTGIKISKERINQYGSGNAEDICIQPASTDPENPGTLVHFKLKLENLW
jgi:ligand-binding sensor domain-containing protein